MCLGSDASLPRLAKNAAVAANGNECVIVDFTEQPLVVHPVAPESAQFRTGQRFSELTGEVKHIEAFARKLSDPRGIGTA
ncbi:MAG: hypothetical protein OXC26_01355 [Albidovulum sp.]|nr:hypothetical protein [Albidovulum sp.]